MAALSGSPEDLQAFADSRSTSHFEAAIPKSTFLAKALTERFEAMRIEEAAKASAPPPRPLSPVTGLGYQHRTKRTGSEAMGIGKSSQRRRLQMA